MKILYFSPVQIDGNNIDIKGTGNWIGCLLNAIAKYDGTHELSVAFHDKKIKKIEKTKINNFLITKIPTSGRNSSIGKLIDNWTIKDIYKNFLNHYLKIIEDLNPDIIQIFGLEHPFIRILGNTDIPVVLHLQGLLGPCSFKYYQRFSNRELLFGTKFLSIINGSIPIIHKKKIKKHLILEELVYHKCQYILGRTEWDRMFSKAVAPASYYYRCHEIMRNAFYKYTWEKKRNKIYTIFTTTKDGPYKNLDIIFETIKLLQRFNKNFYFFWRVAGTDSVDRTAKIMRKRGCNFNNLRLLGKLNSHEIITEMRQADLFVYPSAIDNSPNALQEAMLIGMPVIASHAGGVSSLIDHNKTGILVPEGEPYSMAGAIIESYKNYDRAKQMGKKARKIAIDRNDPEKIVRSLLDTYEDIVNTKESTKKDACYK